MGESTIIPRADFPDIDAPTFPARGMCGSRIVTSAMKGRGARRHEERDTFLLGFYRVVMRRSLRWQQVYECSAKWLPHAARSKHNEYAPIRVAWPSLQQVAL